MRMHSHDVKIAEQKNILIAIALTSSIMGVEIAGGILSNSLALLSDAWHMFADLMALALCYIAGTISIRPATWEKTYGYYRVEILAAFINGATLVIVAAFIFYEALQRFFVTAEVHSTPMLITAVIGLVANLISMTVMSRRMLSLNVKAAFLHVLSDALSSVGVIAGAIIIYFTKFYLIDALIGIGIGIVIIYGTSRMLRTVVHILLEGTPHHIAPKKVVETLKGLKGILDVHDIHIWSITSYVHILSAHIVLDHEIEDTNALLNTVKTILQEKFGIQHSTLQLEKEGYQETGQVCCI
ncbi:cation diffusion facilitator family transporter [[Eubacterium] cellulosolvens]